MKKSTKLIAWFWLSAGFIIACLYVYPSVSVHFAPPIIKAALVIAFTLIPAVSLLKGGKGGWLAIVFSSLLAFSGLLYVLVVMLSPEKLSVASLPVLAIPLICFFGLLADRPEKWRVTEPAGKKDARVTVLDGLSMAISVIAAVPLIVLVPGIIGVIIIRMISGQ